MMHEWNQYDIDFPSDVGVFVLVHACSYKLHPFCCRPRMWQVDLKADVSTAVVTELTPKTDYSLTVYAIYPSLIGDSAAITVQTSECHMPLQAHAPL